MNKSSALKLIFINIVLLVIVFTQSPIIYPERVQLTKQIFRHPVRGIVYSPRQEPLNFTPENYQHKNIKVYHGQDNNQEQRNDPNDEKGNNGLNPIKRMNNVNGRKNPKFEQGNGRQGQKEINSEIAKLKLENKELMKIVKRMIKDKVYYRRELRKLRKKNEIKKNKRRNRRRNRRRGNKRRNRRNRRRRGNKRRNRRQNKRRENRRRNRRQNKRGGNKRIITLGRGHLSNNYYQQR